MAVIVVVVVAMAQWFRWTTALLVGWDVGLVVYAALVLAFFSRATVASMKDRARLLDRGKWVDLTVAMLASLASLAAIVAEMVATKGTPTAPFSAALAGVTVLLSWAFVQVFFAQQYAHDYWLQGRGLDFPGNDAPTYSEFLYFSFTVGMTAQVSDVTTRSAPMRRLVLLHGLLSFVFNTAVIALGVNLAAGLAG
nr:DUF1345 domain-containing protein [Azospirillum rugosum]